MSSEALTSYAESIVRNAQKLVGELEVITKSRGDRLDGVEKRQVEVDIAEWLNYFS
jgi:hypothetical protein